MDMDRRELLRQFGAAAAVGAFLPSLVEPVASAADLPRRLVRLNRNESAYGPGEKARVAFHEAHSRRDPCKAARGHVE